MFKHRNIAKTLSDHILFFARHDSGIHFFTNQLTNKIFYKSSVPCNRCLCGICHKNICYTVLMICKKNIVGSAQAAPCKWWRIDIPWCSNTEIQQKPYQPTHPFLHDMIQVQSTLVILNSKGLSEILRDIRTSTYQICRIQEKLIRLTTFNKYMCNWTLEVRDILKILWKRGDIAPKEQFLLFSIIFFTLLDFHV